MSRSVFHRGRLGRAVCVLILVPFLAAAAASIVAAEEPRRLEEITVTGTREGELKSETPASVSVISGETIDSTRPAHPAEIMNRVPGAVVMPTTGEGHITGIRNPFGTDPLYLYLEDGIPTRSTGFFNHNALYEVNLPQADGIEVIRGPGSSLHGSDAIGGVVNALTRAPSAGPETRMSAEVGSFGWRRFLGTTSSTWGETGVRGDLNLTHTDGWRDSTGYDRQSATMRADHVVVGGAVVKTVLSATNVDQETGANSRVNEADYRDNPTRNYTPIAFRKVQAVRLSSAYEAETRDSLISLTPYLRWNKMELLPSWQLSYDPVVYNTGHASFGVLAKQRQDFPIWRTRLIVGADLDYSPGYRTEDKLSTTKTGDIYTAYALNGRIYDYSVVFMQASPYMHLETSPIERLRVTAGMRVDLMRYEYDNHLSTLTTTNWRRPEDDNRNYVHPSPHLGATYALPDGFNVFTRYKHSFRVPSESQLFRQGQNNDSVRLSPIKANTYEIGVRRENRVLAGEVALYRTVKTDDILTSRDETGRTLTNSGTTQHEGIEAALDFRPTPEWRLTATGAYAEHTYRSWSSREGNFTGKEMRTAPNIVAGAAIGYTPAALPGARLELEWVHIGAYQMDDANTHEYGGHHLLNLRGAYALTDSVGLFGRAMNLLDRRWATTAEYTSGREEFVPGLPLTVFGGIEVKF